MATDLPRMEAELDLTEGEEELAQAAKTKAAETDINYTQVLTQLHMSKQLLRTTQALENGLVLIQAQSKYLRESVGNTTVNLKYASDHLHNIIKESTKRLIDSNERLAQSADRTAKRLNGLTWVLVVLTVLLVVLGVLTIVRA